LLSLCKHIKKCLAIVRMRRVTAEEGGRDWRDEGGGGGGRGGGGEEGGGTKREGLEAEKGKGEDKGKKGVERKA